MKMSQTALAGALIVLAIGVGWHLADFSPSRSGERPGATVLTPVAVTTDFNSGNRTDLQAAETPAAPGSQATEAAASDDQAPLIFSTGPWTPRVRNTQPLRRGETAASRAVRAEAKVEREGFPQLLTLKKGDRISIPVRGSRPTMGVVNLVKTEVSGWVRVGGKLEDAEGGSFSLGQKGKEFAGLVRRPQKEQAFLITSAADGSVTMLEKPLRSVECRGIPRKPDDQNGAEAAPGGGGVEPLNYAGMVVPAHDTIPGATSVLYIDFDGELVEDSFWNSGYPINARPAVIGTKVISQAMMTDIVKRVSEDMAPFNISVTTLRDRYDNAAVGSRMRCIVTSTNYWLQGAGGVAFLGSFAEAGSNFDDDVPCWAFAGSNYTAMDLGIIISHEAGHTFGLSHDSLLDSAGVVLVQEYYPGHGNWVPIMGASYSRTISQWSKCEFRNGANYTDEDYNFSTGRYEVTGVFKEDDLAIISNVANGFGYMVDDHIDTPPASLLPNTGIFNQSGIIHSLNDVDVFKFETAGGPAVITVTPASQPNLNVRLELRDAANTLVAFSDATGVMGASISRTLLPGIHSLHIRGAADGNPFTTGFSTYGSLGGFNLAGTFAALPVAVPSIITDPASVVVASGQKASFTVVASSNIPLTYQWKLNGNNIIGASKSTYAIAKAGPANIGTYRCVVTNSVGSTTSQDATLSLNFKPIITVKPLATTVGIGGGPLTLTIGAIGTETLHYQWQKNNQNVGADSPTFTVPVPVFQDGGSYRCIVSNTFGSVTSTAVKVVVTAAPVVTVDPPVSKGMPLGGSSSLSITAVGTATLKYQWFQGSNPIPKATSPTFKLSKITSAMAGSYKCVVTNTHGTDESDVCVVTVGVPPAVTTHPAPVTVDAGQPINLTAAASGDPTLNFQWQRDGLDIPSMGATLTIPAAAWTDKGVYRVIVSNAFGSATSKTATVSINSVPVVISDPVSSKAARNKTVKLVTVAGGTPSLKYQWFKDGIAIPKATAASYSYKATTTAAFHCVVTNTLGSDTSASATITVEDPPLIPAFPSTKPAPLGGLFTFGSGVTGSPTLQFQWKKNKVDIPGQNTNTLSIANFSAADAGTYSLVAWNDVGVATSKSMKVVPQTIPSIVTPPDAQNAFAFQTVSFEVKAIGTATLAYQWMLNGNDIPTTTNSTAKKSKLTIASVGAPHVGNYSVRVSNAVGSVVSNAAALSVAEVAVPTVTSTFPSQGNYGHYIRVTGTNLNWTTSVRLVGTAGSPIAPHTIVSPTELLVTVPATGAGSYQIVVNTRGGTVPNAGNFQMLNTSSNDLFANARVVPSTGGTLFGNLPIAFSPEGGEPDHCFIGYGDPDLEATFSAWHEFVPTVSGTYNVSTEGSGFDTRVAIYTGNAVSSLTPVGHNDDFDPDYREYHSYTRFEAVAGERYRIVVDGYDYPGYLAYGNYKLAVTLNTFSIPQGMVAKSLSTAGKVSVDEDTDSVTLGGEGSNMTSLAWAPLTLEGDEIQYSATVSFTTTESSSGEMGITAGGEDGGALFGLRIKAVDGSLELVDAAGSASSTGQTLVPGAEYGIVIRVNQVAHTWSALLNGAWLCRDAAFPESAVGVLSSQFVPGTSTAPATFTVRNASAAGSAE